jgi:hypothetical protein
MAIQSILELFDLKAEPPAALELAESESSRCINEGNFLGAGEWLASSLPYLPEDEVERAFSNLIALWASLSERRVIPM